MKELFELVRYVRAHSPFYKELYRSLPKEITSIEQLPIIQQDQFWAANTLEKNQLLSSPMKDGLVLRSGGTSGNPKFSVFSHQEWDEFTRDFAVGFSKTGVRDGDRIANLFYSGELYGSFLFMHRLIETCPVPLLSLPIGGSAPIAEVMKTLIDFKATVVAALPTTIMKIVSELENNREIVKRLHLRLFLFAGEAMYPDQRARISQLIPGSEVRTVGYASNDAGFLGYADDSCGPNEFRRHDGSTIYEIVDEDTGLAIHEPGKPGRALITDLRRKLMPVIRYPAGDRAEWIEPQGTPDRKFLLLGRTEEAARVASLSLYFDDVRGILEKFRPRLGTFQFQLITIHEDSLDGLILRIGSSNDQPFDRTLEAEIIQAIHHERPTIEQFALQGKIIPLRVEWRGIQELETNPRTGKLKRIIDQRGL